MNTLAELQREIHETAKEKGWWDEQREFGTLMALVHSEVSEALEAWRESDLPVHYRTTDDKPEGWGVELADCAIRILDMCEANGLDLQTLIEEKMAYNKTRPFRHGGKRA